MTSPSANSADGPRSVGNVELCLVQHGQAKTKDQDPDRALTDKGAADVMRVARCATEQLGVRPTRVFHSGKTRALQTAEAWSQLLATGVEAASGLDPNDDPSIWASRLDSETSDLLVVGHLPHLQRLAALLLTGDADRPVLRFHQGGLVVVERNDERWVTSVLLPPDAA